MRHDAVYIWRHTAAKTTQHAARRRATLPCTASGMNVLRIYYYYYYYYYKTLMFRVALSRTQRCTAT